MLAISQAVIFLDGINDSEPDINSEARGKKSQFIPRNNIVPGINKTWSMDYLNGLPMDYPRWITLKFEANTKSI